MPYAIKFIETMAANPHIPIKGEKKVTTAISNAKILLSEKNIRL